MASTVLPLASSQLNSLPSILHRVFVKHNVKNVFRYTLVHQHFELRDDERLVNYGNVAIPMKEVIESKVAATRWVLNGEKAIPYEYAFGADSIDMDRYHVFLEELRSLLNSQEMSKHLGLWLIVNNNKLLDQPTMEFTTNGMNVTLPVDIDPENGSSVETTWEVCEGPGHGAIVFGRCKERRKSGPNTGHNKRHMYTKT